MAKNTRQNGSYTVGYGRPPVSTRFSSSNQPQRPSAPLKQNRKSTLELGAEKVEVTRADGTVVECTRDEIIWVKLIERALSAQRLSDVTDLYVRLDAEEDAYANDAWARVSERQQREIRKSLKDLLTRYRTWQAQMLDLGVAARGPDGAVALSPRAQQAIWSAAWRGDAKDQSSVQP